MVALTKLIMFGIATVCALTLTFIVLEFVEDRVISKFSKKRNRVHFYVARDKGGYLYLHIGKPFRDGLEFRNKLEIYYRLRGDNFKYLGLKEKDYDYLKWEDEPVEVFVNIED